MAAATVLAVAINHFGNDIEEKDSFFLMYWTLTAGLLNLALKLGASWREDWDVSNIKPHWTLLANVLWLGVCLSFRGNWPLDVSWNNAAIALGAFAVASVFLAPAWRKDGNDTGLWNHIIDCAISVLITFAVGGLIIVGLALLMLALIMLFGVEISTVVTLDVSLICVIFIAPMIFMQLLPGKLRRDVDRPGKTGLNLVNYVLFPLLGAYLLTLYAYAAKIVFGWSLPRGSVSIPIIVSMMCLVLMIFLIYPVQFRGQQDRWRFDRKALRLMPAIFLPLLPLMTIAVAKRVCDYGITPQRLYLALFNLWGYAVCLGLIFNKSRRFWWIPASFIALMLLSSVGPQNFAAVTRRTMVRQVKGLLGSQAQGLTFPLDSAKYSGIMETGDKDIILKADREMEYLYRNYPNYVVREIVDSTVGTWNIGSWASKRMNTASSEDPDFRWVEIDTRKSAIIPKGFTRFEQTIFHDRLTLSDTIVVKVSQDSVSLVIPVSEIDRAKEEGGTSPLWFYGDGAVFFTNSLSINPVCGDLADLRLDGILFQR